MRALTLVFVVSAASLFAACPQPTKECSAATCSGCCDATGQCQGGNSLTACGTSGNQCTACASGTCNLGFCSTTVTGGSGGSGGGTSGGGTATGGSGGTGGGSGALTTYSDFCNAALRAQFDYYVRCGAYTREYADSYVAEAVAQCANTPDLFTSGRARFSPTGAQACIDTFANLTCTRGLTSSGCSEAVTGLVANGGACYYSQECVTGHWCDTASTCPGACKPHTAVGQPSTSQYGEDCGPNGYRYEAVCETAVALGGDCFPVNGSTQPRGCVAGAVCSSSTFKCVENVNLAPGAACTANMTPECSVGTSCVNSVCTAYGDLNQPCDSVRLCKFGLQCSAANVCVRYGATGATCGGTGASCDRGLFCNLATGTTSGTCAAQRPSGGTCTNQEMCQSPLWCNGSTATPGVCGAKLTVGATCQREYQYWACDDALYCTTVSNSAASGVCAVRKGAGASCLNSSECVSSTTCTNSVCTRSYCAP